MPFQRIPANISPMAALYLRSCRPQPCAETGDSRSPSASFRHFPEISGDRLLLGISYLGAPPRAFVRVDPEYGIEGGDPSSTGWQGSVNMKQSRRHKNG